MALALEKYGNNWQKVQLVVKTRTAAQIRSHAQKYKLKQMYDEAQEKFKHLKEEERFLFRIVKAKKRKPKQDPAQEVKSVFGVEKLFDVKRYVAPNGGSSSNKGLPSSGSESSSSQDGEGGSRRTEKSNQSMRSRSQDSPKSEGLEVIENEKLEIGVGVKHIDLKVTAKDP